MLGYLAERLRIEIHALFIDRPPMMDPVFRHAARAYRSALRRRTQQAHALDVCREQARELAEAKKRIDALELFNGVRCGCGVVYHGQQPTCSFCREKMLDELKSKLGYVEVCCVELHNEGTEIEFPKCSICSADGELGDKLVKKHELGCPFWRPS